LTAAGMLVQVFRQPTSPTVQHWRIPVTACFAGFLVQSQFGDAAFGLQAIVFFTNLAMITILWRLHRQAQPDQR